MTIEVNVIDNNSISGLSADNGVHRMVVDAKNKEVRLFTHYINEEGKPKLKTIHVTPLEDLMERLAAEIEDYEKGEAQ
jgi:hypothetical protein